MQTTTTNQREEGDTMTTTEKIEITTRCCHRCGVSVLTAGVLLVTPDERELCLDCVDALEREARTERILAGREKSAAAHAEAAAAMLARLDEEEAELAKRPAYRYQVEQLGDGPTVARLARHAGRAGWLLSTGVRVLEEDDLETCHYVAAYLNAKIQRTSSDEGLEPLETIEKVLVRRALESIVWELADGDEDDLEGITIDAACWSAVGTTRQAELGQ